MKVNICGVPHKIVECEDNFNVDMHFGQIDYKACEIRVNKDMTIASKKETICHEMIHGIFIHLGYNDYAQDEQLVQALGNAIYQGFNIRLESEDRGREDGFRETEDEAYQKGFNSALAVKAEILKKERQEGYNIGYSDGINLKQKDVDEAYNKGLNEAWYYVRKIFCMPCETVKQLFHTAYYPEILDRFSVSEAIEVIKDREEKQKKEQEKAERQGRN